MGTKRKRGKKEERKTAEENERKRENKGKAKKNYSSAIFFGQGKETEFLTYWKYLKATCGSNNRDSRSHLCIKHHVCDETETRN